MSTARSVEPRSPSDEGCEETRAGKRAQLEPRSSTAHVSAVTSAPVRELLFRHRGTLLILTAAPIAAGCVDLPFTWIDGAVGLAFLALGPLIRLVSVRRIGKRARVANPGAAHLLSEGPYAHARNPLYLGNLSIAAGACVTSGLRAWSLLVVLGVLSVYQLVVLGEEETLGELFGERYALYKQRVPRWLPRMTGSQPVDQLEPAPLFAWSEVVRRESPCILGVASLAAALLYIKLSGPGVVVATGWLDRIAARLLMPRWALIASIVAVLAVGEGLVTFHRRRRHALRKIWWASLQEKAEQERLDAASSG